MKEDKKSSSNIYFTYSPRNCGFTDNLERYDICYRLGLSLGYDYVHTPLITPRTTKNIDTFLGFDNYFPLKITDLDLENHIHIQIDIFSLFQEREYISLHELQHHIREIISSRSSDNIMPIVVFTISSRYQSPVVKLSRDLLLDSAQNTPQLDYRLIFNLANKMYPRKSRFTRGKPKMLVHIRQGDTAIIKTPWNRYIPLTKLKRHNIYHEYKNRRDIDDRTIDVDEFYQFLRQLIKRFEHSFFSIIVSSDGYQRAFKKLYKNKHNFKFTQNQINKLEKSEKTYTNSQFSNFQKLDDCVCIVGETDENLLDLIHSALNANIIVTGTQQRMIPKLLAFYSDQDFPQIMLVLHRSNHIPDLPPLNKTSIHIIYVDLDNMDIASIASELHLLMNLLTK